MPVEERVACLRNAASLLREPERRLELDASQVADEDAIEVTHLLLANALEILEAGCGRKWEPELGDGPHTTSDNI